MSTNAVETALKHVERNERNHRIAVLSGAMLEAIFLAAFLLVADLSNRTHVLRRRCRSWCWRAWRSAPSSIGTRCAS
jgi:hypothetical protein